MRALTTIDDHTANSILRRVEVLRGILLTDCLHGEVVKKHRIPSTLKLRYSVSNLYVEDLPGFWRLLYTVGRRQGKRFVVVIALVDHRKYSKWFRRPHG